jgi:hypothetical protein
MEKDMPTEQTSKQTNKAATTQIAMAPTMITPLSFASSHKNLKYAHSLDINRDKVCT